MKLMIRQPKVKYAIDALSKHSPYSGIWAGCTGLKAVGASAYIRLRKMPFTNLQHLPSTESRLNQVGRLWLNEIHRIENGDEIFVSICSTCHYPALGKTPQKL